MNTPLLFSLVFGCNFGAGGLATRHRLVMPGHHLSVGTKDLVKLALGLGLLVSSAKCAG